MRWCSAPGAASVREGPGRNPRPDHSLGGINLTRHSYTQMENLLAGALGTVDDDARRALLQRASAPVIDSFGIIPIHFKLITGARRPGIEYEARADQYTLAQSVLPRPTDRR